MKCFAPVFYAEKDTKTPFIIATICVVLNLILNLILMQYYAHVGLAAATSIASWVNTLLLVVVLLRRGRFAPSRKLILRVLKMCVACSVMGAALLYSTAYPEAYTTLGLGVMVALAMVVYGLFSVVFGVARPSDIKRALRKQ